MTEPTQGAGATGSGGEPDPGTTIVTVGSDGAPPPPPPIPGRTYLTGHVKRNPATGEVALRTGFSEDLQQLAALAWCVATPAQGARTAATAEVAGWDDLHDAGM